MVSNSSDCRLEMAGSGNLKGERPGPEAAGVKAWPDKNRERAFVIALLWMTAQYEAAAEGRWLLVACGWQSLMLLKSGGRAATLPKNHDRGAAALTRTGLTATVEVMLRLENVMCCVLWKLRRILNGVVLRLEIENCNAGSVA